MLVVVSSNRSVAKPPPNEVAPGKVVNESMIFDVALLAGNVLAPPTLVNESVIHDITLVPRIVHTLSPANVANASVIYAQTITKNVVTSYDNPGGKGNRTGIITVTTTGTLAAGTPSNFVDGAFANTSADAAWWGGGGAGLSITFDFGVGKAVVIQEAKHFADVATGQGTWKWRGSPDGIAWTDLSAGFTFSGSPTGNVLGNLSANNMPFRFYQQLQTSGITSSAMWMREWEFKIAGL